MRGLRPWVSVHAVERAISRSGANLAGSRREVSARIVREVADGVEAGRSGKTAPRWLTPVGRRKKTRNEAPDRRYVWDVSETRVYVVRPGDVEGERRLIVVTVLTPDDAETSEWKEAKSG